LIINILQHYNENNYFELFIKKMVLITDLF